VFPQFSKYSRDLCDDFSMVDGMRFKCVYVLLREIRATVFFFIFRTKQQRLLHFSFAVEWLFQMKENFPVILLLTVKFLNFVPKFRKTASTTLLLKLNYKFKRFDILKKSALFSFD